MRLDSRTISKGINEIIRLSRNSSRNKDAIEFLTILLSQGYAGVMYECTYYPCTRTVRREHLFVDSLSADDIIDHINKMSKKHKDYKFAYVKQGDVISGYYHKNMERTD